MSKITFIKRGSGPQLLLIPGLGGNSHSFDSILNDLAKKREVIAIDLPEATSISALSDAITEFLVEKKWIGIDALGVSMGARLILELTRRGVLGNALALNPGGFWQGWERHAFYTSLFASVKLVRALQPVMIPLMKEPAGRVGLLSQLSAHPTQVDFKIALQEMRSFAQYPQFEKTLWELAYGETQLGMPKKMLKKRLIIGWGRKDKVTLPVQADRALEKFPDAKLVWFEEAGHFPHWDSPKEVVKLILKTTQEIKKTTYPKIMVQPPLIKPPESTLRH